MDLTESYKRAVPAPVRGRYDWLETRNAAAVIAASDPQGFQDILTVLDQFSVEVQRDLIDRGGNQTAAAALLNASFRQLGWREGSYRMRISSQLTLRPYRQAGERDSHQTETELDASSYRIDNIKGRLALDVEWHAKDGNLDRDISAYRALYDSGIIDAGCIITVNLPDMRAWAQEVNPGTTKFNTTTTVNIGNLVSRLTRGDAGGCPILAVGVCRRTV